MAFTGILQTNEVDVNHKQLPTLVIIMMVSAVLDPEYLTMFIREMK